MKKHIIWSNRDIDHEQWKSDFVQHRIECGYDNPNDFTDIDLYEWIDWNLSDCLDDERANLNIALDEDILVIADLGLWDGRKQGYNIIKGNVSNILNVRYDFAEWYSDGYNIKGVETHHDGTNYYEYRVIRKNRNIQKLLDAIYNGEKITRKKLNYYTKSLHPYVAQVYGW